MLLVGSEAGVLYAVEVPFQEETMPLVALLVLAAQAGGTAAGTVPSPARIYPVCTGVRVTAPDRALPPKNLTFSSRETLDLLLRPRLRLDFKGEHLMQLKVFTPGGFLYQVITLPFVGAALPDARERPVRTGNGAAARAADPPPPRVVPGFPRPLETQRLVPVFGDTVTRAQYELSARLPVAGTSITLSSLFGTWSVQSYLDGHAEPCGPATRFTIRD
jgi:hypothetical protein